MNKLELNALVREFFEEQEKELNKNSVFNDWVVYPGDTYNVPELKHSLLNSTTVVASDSNAFNLNAPVAGKLKSITIKGKDIGTVLTNELLEYRDNGMIELSR